MPGLLCCSCPWPAAAWPAWPAEGQASALGILGSSPPPTSAPTGLSRRGTPVLVLSQELVDVGCPWRVAHWASWVSHLSGAVVLDRARLPSLSLPRAALRSSSTPPKQSAFPKRETPWSWPLPCSLWARPHNAVWLACVILATGGFLVDMCRARGRGLEPGTVHWAVVAADVHQSRCFHQSFANDLKGSVGNSLSWMGSLGVGAGQCARDREGTVPPMSSSTL